MKTADRLRDLIKRSGEPLAILRYCSMWRCYSVRLLNGCWWAYDGKRWNPLDGEDIKTMMKIHENHFECALTA